MIQRIQHLFLLISGIFILLLLLHSLQGNWGWISLDNSLKNPYIVIVIAIYIVVLSINIGTIFYYKKLSSQLLFLRIGLILLNINLIILLFHFLSNNSISSKLDIKILIFFLLVYLFNILAIKYIRKDINLLRSADRLR